jgi:hypothetical protein
MRLRHFLVPLVVAAVGMVGIQGAASAAPVTKQNFSLTNDISQEGGTVVASGAINATGEDIVISDTEDQFVFPDGTLTIIHAPVRSKDHFNDKKCTGRFHEAGTYVISAGTDQYEGVTGSGSYRAAGSFENACQEIPTGTFSIRARGSINLPS